jgi:hypothetical protein
MRRMLIFAFLLGAWSYGSTATAEDPVVVACHGCSDRRAMLTAEAQVPTSARAGVYDVYVADTPGNRLRMYRVTLEKEHRTASKFSQQRSASSEYLSYFSHSKGEWDYVAAATKPNIVLPPDFPVRSAESVFGSEFNQTVISEQLNRHVPTRIGSLFGAALMMMRTVFSSPILAEVEFPDGSQAFFRLDRIDSLTSGHMFVYRYVPGTAKDSDGNRIPDSASAFDNFEGRYTVEANLSMFLRRAEMYGVDWPEGFRPEQIPAHTVCARDDEDNAYCWHH